jgi:peroxiredoxin
MAHGVNAASITYDSREVLEAFGTAYNIEFPLLSDVGSKVIRAFGILNTNVPEDHKMMYGMPFPGDYLIAPDGTVRDKCSCPVTSIGPPHRKWYCGISASTRAEIPSKSKPMCSLRQ